MFEGEGCISFRHPNGVLLNVESTDEDTIRNLHDVVGFGNFRVNPSRNPKWKTTYQWYAQRKDDVVWLLWMMLPHLSKRRQGKALEGLRRLKNSKGRAW